MFLDADLAGVTAADVQALADPVIGGRAQVSISLRRNSLPPYRWLGLDFVSGERVIPAQLMDQAVEAMEQLPRWGCEAFINDLIIQEAPIDRRGRLADGVQHAQVRQARALAGHGRRTGDDQGRGRFSVADGRCASNLALLMLVRRDWDDYAAAAASESSETAS